MKTGNKKGKNAQSPGSSGFLPRVLGMGNLEMNYQLKLTNEDIKQIDVNFKDIANEDDLMFLLEHQYLWNKIQLTTNNYILNMLLFMNKVTDNKIYIEYIPLEIPYYDENEEKFGKMFNDINEFNFLFLNKSDTFNSSCQMNFTLEYGDEKKEFCFGKGVKKEEENNQGENKEENKDPDKSKFMSNEESSLYKIKLDCKQYEYFICDFEVVFGLFEITEFIEFIMYIKIKLNANIIIKYPNVINLINENEKMNQLNKLYLLTDTFIIDTKDAIANFNQHFQSFSTNKAQAKEINEKNLNDYFITTISCGGDLSLVNSKVAFFSYFIDDLFTKITIIEVPMNIKPSIYSYDVKPYPKISHSNVDVINLYKEELKKDKKDSNFFQSIFYSGVLSVFVFGKNKVKGFEKLYPSYLTGIEILKRILELKVKDINPPNLEKFYKVRLDKKELENAIKKNELDKKEGKFVLDCVNEEKSKMKYYVPLFDYNLHQYFKSNIVQKELKTKGFINSKGFINYDPQYRKEMNKVKAGKNQKRSNSKTNAKEIIKKQIENNDINNKKKILHSVPPTIKRLPVEHCEYTSKIQKAKCMHKKDVRYSNKEKDCQFCKLHKQLVIEEKIEEEKRKSMQLRRYDN